VELTALHFAEHCVQLGQFESKTPGQEAPLVCASALARKLNLRRIQAIQRLAAKAMIDKDPISFPPSDREILAPIRRVCRMTKQTKMLLAYIASRREVDQADLEKPRINKPR
jgi:hypothetical protein